MKGYLITLAVLLAVALSIAGSRRRRPRWTVTREDLLPLARPFMHRSMGRRMHVRR